MLEKCHNSQNRSQSSVKQLNSNWKAIARQGILSAVNASENSRKQAQMIVRYLITNERQKYVQISQAIQSKIFMSGCKWCLLKFLLLVSSFSLYNNLRLDKYHLSFPYFPDSFVSQVPRRTSQSYLKRCLYQQYL